MIFQSTKIPGVYVIEQERHEDHRGYFARTWCRQEFAAQGLETQFVQCSVSHNERRGTLRGMHYQSEPHSERKLVQVTRGAIFDVIIDLRADSPTYKAWFGLELTSDKGTMLYIPDGCAHGFMTLSDNTDVHYQMTDFFHPESAAGVRWNDPSFSIRWPLEPVVINERDNQYEDYVR
ncbi:MAG: dTDP-4-dehydrorhamnose 3,5-epimerase [Pirellulales bacterium]|nr:dTDP-4-dehydrorhamnose 3,5-epimerase [Pirellulales bacterium]